MPPTASARSPAVADQAFVSEVFHELSQPLSALQCVLELSLRRNCTAKELRTTVQKALENCDRLRQRLVLMRALNDAYAQREPGQTTDLNGLLRELHADMLPLFAGSGRCLEVRLQCHEVLVRAGGPRVSRALFCFLEYLFRYANANSTTTLSLNVLRQGSAELRIESGVSLPVPLQTENRQPAFSFEAELVRRTFQASGGDFRIESYDPTQCIWQGMLPMA